MFIPEKPASHEHYNATIEDLCRTTIEFFTFGKTRTLTFHYIIFLVNCYHHKWYSEYLVDPKSFYLDAQGPKIKYLHECNIDPMDIKATDLAPVQNTLNERAIATIKSVHDTLATIHQRGLHMKIQHDFPQELARLENRPLKKNIRQDVVSYWKSNKDRFDDLVGIWHDLAICDEEFCDWLGLSWEEYVAINEVSMTK